jgi:hypothetical protein
MESDRLGSARSLPGTTESWIVWLPQQSGGSRVSGYLSRPTDSGTASHSAVSAINLAVELALHGRPTVPIDAPTEAVSVLAAKGPHK